MLTFVTGWDYFRKSLPYPEGRDMIDVLYFAWVRERIGLPREQVETAAATVADLVAELSAREERYAAGLCRSASAARGAGSGAVPISMRPWPACARSRSSRR